MMRLLTLTTTLLAITHQTFAAVPGVIAKISLPSPIRAGTVTITLADGGGSPGLSALSSGTVQLVAGGNVEGTDAIILAALGGAVTYPNALTLAAAIDPGLAPSITNGFYLKVTSQLTDGGYVINYSDRFSIAGMTGSIAQKYITAAAQAGAVSPAYVLNVQAAAPAAGTPDAGLYATPYPQQTGLTKYAPMQSVPPTRITKNGNPTPLFPTSAYTVATTRLPNASIKTTLTLAQTFSVVSIENPAAAQSQPTGDMAKFLARWKD